MSCRTIANVVWKMGSAWRAIRVRSMAIRAVNVMAHEGWNETMHGHAMTEGLGLKAIRIKMGMY